MTNTADYHAADSGGSTGYFIYDTSGADAGLYWDPTGGDSSDAVLFVKLSGITSLLSSDFLIV